MADATAAQVSIVSGRQGICVLGMHRSGTSLVTGVLRILGAELGPDSGLLPAVPHDNPRGFWEQREVNELNDDILAAWDTDFWRPRRLPEGWELRDVMEPFRARARELLRSIAANADVWAIKDPRLCLTWALWRSVITDEPRYVVCVRHPLEVAASLRARNNRSLGNTLDMWERYTTDALWHSHGRERLIVHYDDWFTRPDAQLERLARWAGLEVPAVGSRARAAFEMFVDDSLWHNRSSIDELAGARHRRSVVGLYLALDAERRADETSTAHREPTSIAERPHAEKPTGSDLVLAGNEGWLFHRRDAMSTLDQLTGRRTLSADDIERWNVALERRAEWAERRDIPYVALVGPEKHAVYADKLPPEIRSDILAVDRRPVPLLCSAVAQRGRISPPLYPLDALIESRATCETYHRTDSHWNAFGAFVAYRIVARALVDAGARIEPLSDEDVGYALEDRAGDLGGKLQPPRSAKSIVARLRRPRAEREYDNRVRNNGLVRIYRRTDAAASSVDTVLVVGDSFGYGLLPYIAATFRRTVFVHLSRGFDYRFAEAVAADVMLTVAVERFMIDPPLDGCGEDERLSRHVREKQASEVVDGPVVGDWPLSRDAAALAGIEQSEGAEVRQPPVTTTEADAQAPDSRSADLVRDVRDDFVQRVAPGHSFCDVGGLWGTVNEKVSLAHAAGATELNMLDISPPDSVLWERLRERLAQRGIEGCRQHTGNVDDPSLPDRVGTFEVVHSSGVLYHCPNPLHTLQQLRRLATRYLILTSVIVPPTIPTEDGVINLQDGLGVFIPHMGPRLREALRRYFANAGVPPVPGIGSDFDAWDPDDYGPWWWLFPPSTLENMLRAVGWRVLDHGPVWGGRSHAFLAEW